MLISTDSRMWLEYHTSDGQGTGFSAQYEGRKAVKEDFIKIFIFHQQIYNSHVVKEKRSRNWQFLNLVFLKFL